MNLAEMELSEYRSQNAAPAPEEIAPVAQFLQVVIPGEEYLPDVQSVHADVPVTAEYLPAAQFTQVAAVVAPTTEEYSPVSHRVQAEVPVFIAYDPAGQFVQGAAPPGENFPAGHMTQVLAEDAPTTSEDVPAIHPGHTEAPMFAE